MWTGNRYVHQIIDLIAKHFTIQVQLPSLALPSTLSKIIKRFDKKKQKKEGKKTIKKRIHITEFQQLGCK